MFSIHRDESFELSLEHYGIKDHKASGNILHFIDDDDIYRVCSCIFSFPQFVQRTSYLFVYGYSRLMFTAFTVAFILRNEESY